MLAGCSCSSGCSCSAPAAACDGVGGWAWRLRAEPLFAQCVHVHCFVRCPCAVSSAAEGVKLVCQPASGRQGSEGLVPRLGARCRTASRFLPVLTGYMPANSASGCGVPLGTSRGPLRPCHPSGRYSQETERLWAPTGPTTPTLQLCPSSRRHSIEGDGAPEGQREGRREGQREGQKKKPATSRPRARTTCLRRQARRPLRLQPSPA